MTGSTLIVVMALALYAFARAEADAGLGLIEAVAIEKLTDLWSLGHVPCNVLGNITMTAHNPPFGPHQLPGDRLSQTRSIRLG